MPPESSNARTQVSLERGSSERNSPTAALLAGDHGVSLTARAPARRSIEEPERACAEPASTPPVPLNTVFDLPACKSVSTDSPDAPSADSSSYCATPSADDLDMYFSSSDSSRLFWRRWMPETRPLGIVIYLHGGLSHAGDAHRPAAALSAAGLAVYAFDQRGWGHWENEPVGFIDRWQTYMLDIKAFVDFVREYHPSEPLFLVGHSMGGLVAAGFLQEHQHLFQAAILMAPWLETYGSPWWMRHAAHVLAAVVPKHAIKSEFNPLGLSRDESTHPEMYADKASGLRKKTFTSGWLRQMLNLQNEVGVGAGKITLPVLIVHGDADVVADVNASCSFAKSVGGPCEFIMLKGMQHELHNDLGRQVVERHSTEYLLRHMRPTAAR